MSNANIYRDFGWCKMDQKWTIDEWNVMISSPWNSERKMETFNTIMIWFICTHCGMFSVFEFGLKPKVKISISNGCASQTLLRIYARKSDCISHLESKWIHFHCLFLWEPRKRLCSVCFRRKCTFNWIPFHLVYALARDVIITQFPPFCNRIRGYSIWSINWVRFVHNFYDTYTSTVKSSWLLAISYRSRSAFRIGSVSLIRKFSIHRARTRALIQVQHRRYTHALALLFEHYFKTNWINN